MRLSDRMGAPQRARPEPLSDDGERSLEAARASDPLAELKTRVWSGLVRTFQTDRGADLTSPENRERLNAHIDALIASEGHSLALDELVSIRDTIAAEVVGHGPLQPLLDDPTVTEIMVNAPDLIFVERAGRLEETDAAFFSEDHLRRVIDRIVGHVGRQINESSPLVDARMDDGSRVNAIIPPLAIDGPQLTIRKFSDGVLGVEALIENGSISLEGSKFLQAAVEADCNIIVSGGTGTGKTTLLNALSSFIPAGERVVTIEDTAELQLQRRHVVRLESRNSNTEGLGSISIRDLVRNALRMRPDRIVIGECRGAETLDMLQAMNTGHEGSLTTLHANSPRDALSRLETMVLMAGMDLPHRAIREQVAAAIDLIVQIRRMPDGQRLVGQITELDGIEGDTLRTNDIFESKVNHNGAWVLTPTGIVPRVADRIGRQTPVDRSWFSVN